MMTRGGAAVYTSPNPPVANPLIAASLAELRAITISGLQTNTTCVVGGYANPGDGGGGEFVLIKAGMSPDNDGTVVGQWYRIYSGAINVRWFGATGNGVDNDLAALNRAIAALPHGGDLFCPLGTYGVLGSIVCPATCCIIGEGSALAHGTQIVALAGYTPGNSLLKITGGYSKVRNVRFDLGGINGAAIELFGDGGNNTIEDVAIVGVMTGYAGIYGNDSGGANGIAQTNIRRVFFDAFHGGDCIVFDKGGDSCVIDECGFAPITGGYLIKWTGKTGAACLMIMNCNSSGSAKMFEFNTATQFKILNCQFEAAQGAVTNSASAMIVINGPAPGFQIIGGNLNGHSNCANAIYVADAQGGRVDNVVVTNVTYAIKTAGAAAKIRFAPSDYSGVVNDVSDALLAVSIELPFGTTTWFGKLLQKGSAIVNQITKIGVLNWFYGNREGNDFGIGSDAGGAYDFWITAGGNVGLGTKTPSAKLAVNGGVHVGGDSDPGDNNLLVDGTATLTGNLAANGAGAQTFAGPIRATGTRGLSIGEDPAHLRIDGGGAANSLFRFISSGDASTGIEVLRILLGSNGALILAGGGDPEGVVTAPVGSIWIRSADGGVGTTFYGKQAGSGNTGWDVFTLT